MSILIAQELRKTYGPEAILDDVSLSIVAGERLALVGANGCGKSTLCRLLAGLEAPDSGQVIRSRDLRLAYLPQVPDLRGPTALEEVLAGLSNWSAAKERHDEACARLDRGDGDQAALLAAQTEAAAEVERLGGWEMAYRAESILGALGLPDGGVAVARLSGGERRRVALARALVARAGLTILDEPTNHLDLRTVEWLERYLLEEHEGALLLITHDRAFIDHLAQRTLELSHGRLHGHEGGYQAYLEGKSLRLEHESRAEANRQRFLREELQWLRRQPKARTTRQKARVQRAEAVLEQPPTREDRQVQLRGQAVEASKSILELHGLSVELGGRRLVEGLDFILTRGQRVGIIGANGCGKTTLLQTITGDREPQAGTVVRGKGTVFGYLSQGRDDLDSGKTVLENVGEGRTTIRVGEAELDIRAYLDRFLFRGEILRQPVSALSGGERTRVALARLLARPANLLVLDEPTNDLDLTTLGALEQMLIEFAGTALVVTHDRWFLDRVATALLVFEGQGRVVVHAGGYSLYRERTLVEERQAPAGPRVRPQAPAAPAKRRAHGLTYGEELELGGLIPRVEAAEARVRALEARLADPDLYRGPREAVKDVLAELEGARTEAEGLMSRWEALESKRT